MKEAAIPDRPRRRGELVFRQLDDEWVIFDPASHRLHALNLTAALVWEHCTGDLSLQDIAVRIEEAFDDTDADTVLADVTETVERFVAEGLLA